MHEASAEGLVIKLMAAFARELPPETISLYIKHFAQPEFPDEWAEIVYQRLIRTRHRFPSLAEITDAFGDAREEAVARWKADHALPAPADEPDQERVRHGVEHVRSTLIKAGHLPPPKISREPLTTAERRHGIHVKQEVFVDECRFCRRPQDDVS